MAAGLVRAGYLHIVRQAPGQVAWQILSVAVVHVLMVFGQLAQPLAQKPPLTVGQFE